MKINGLITATELTQAKTQPADEAYKNSQQDTSQPKPAITSEKDAKRSGRQPSVSEKAVMDAIEKANKALVGPNQRLEFSIHRPTREIVVKVINNDSGEVIREIPSEKILDMVAKMWEMSGVFVDERR